MITSFKLIGFKRFNNNYFPIQNLTVLTGLNGTGKSTFIQGLLLAREAAINQNSVPLSTPFGVDLGTAEDVLNWYSAEDKITLVIGSENVSSYTLELEIPEQRALYLNVAKHQSHSSLPTAFQKTPRAFTYLCAERIGPRKTYKLSPQPISTIELGVYGENTAQLIEAFGNAPLENNDRIHPLTPEEDAKFLIYQLERWMNDIVRPLQIMAQKIDATDYATLKFKVENGQWVQSTNMGFGVTYALPIILAGLLVPKGGLLLVENPESHLHPAGQSAMGLFLGWLSGKGVQVIVETHSDHILNGIRRAIAERKYVEASAANVLFFDIESRDEMCTQLSFSDNGSISQWPKKFFDQYQIDTAALGKIRRSSLQDGLRN